MITSATETVGRQAARVQRRVGVSKADFLKRLKAMKFSESDRRELKAAIEASATVFGYAGGH